MDAENAGSWPRSVTTSGLKTSTCLNLCLIFASIRSMRSNAITFARYPLDHPPEPLGSIFLGGDSIARKAGSWTALAATGHWQASFSTRTFHNEVLSDITLATRFRVLKKLLRMVSFVFVFSFSSARPESLTFCVETLLRTASNATSLKRSKKCFQKSNIKSL